MENKLIGKVARNFIFAGVTLVGVFSVYSYRHENASRMMDVNMVFDQFETAYQHQEACMEKRYDMYQDYYRRRGKSIDMLLERSPELLNTGGLAQLCGDMDVEAITLLDKDGTVLLSSEPGIEGSRLKQVRDTQSVRAFLAGEKEEGRLILASPPIFPNAEAQDYQISAAGAAGASAMLVGIPDTIYQEVFDTMDIEIVMSNVVTMQDQALLILNAFTGEVLGSTHGVGAVTLAPEIMETFRGAPERKIVMLDKKPFFTQSREYRGMLIVSVQNLKNGLWLPLEQIVWSAIILLIIFVFLTLTIRHYFRDYIYNEFAMIKDTVHDLVNGKVGTRFHTEQKTEMSQIVDALNELTSMNAELSKKVKASDRDSLTGLVNRRGFETYINAYMKGAGKKGVMIIMDIDNFKSVNDNKGHPEGDRVLQVVAKCLKGVFRENDMLVRLGGDEFVVFLNTDIPEKRLREKLDELMQKFREALPAYGRQYHISLSMGASVLSEHCSEYKNLYKCADKALYEAKEGGKNRYVIHTCNQRCRNMQ